MLLLRRWPSSQGNQQQRHSMQLRDQQLSMLQHEGFLSSSILQQVHQHVASSSRSANLQQQPQLLKQPLENALESKPQGISCGTITGKAQQGIAIAVGSLKQPKDQLQPREPLQNHVPHAFDLKLLRSRAWGRARSMCGEKPAHRKLRGRIYRGKIYREDLEKVGYTNGCRGCNAALEGAAAKKSL